MKWFIRKKSSEAPEVFWGKGVLKICIEFTGEHPCRSALCVFLEHLFLRTHLERCFWKLKVNNKTDMLTPFMSIFHFYTPRKRLKIKSFLFAEVVHRYGILTWNGLITINSFMTKVLSYRSQSIDLHSKSVDWLLYDRDLRHERVNQQFKIKGTIEC